MNQNLNRPGAISIQRHTLAAAALLLLALAVTSPCWADDLAEKGRAVFKNYQHAVVTVQLVLKSKISLGGRGGEANESRQEVTGTVIDSSGLTVLSLSATDPSGMLQNMMAGGSDEESRFKMETELGDIKILLDDGSELTAEVVLRDKDLDLAFIRPKTKPPASLTALDLTQHARADILDQVIALNRLGNAAGRAYSASVERISAIVQRPRLFYIPDSAVTTTGLGAPAFTLEGKPLGIFVMRTLKSRGVGGGFFNMQPENVTVIILPCDDILKGMKQVPAAAEAESAKSPSAGSK